MDSNSASWQWGVLITIAYQEAYLLHAKWRLLLFMSESSVHSGNSMWLASGTKPHGQPNILLGKKYFVTRMMQM